MSVKVIRDPGESARVDIVLVHGWLGGNAPWTSEASVFWPEKFLAAKVPEARILSYEYDIELDSFWNEEDLITETSNEMIDLLMEERPEKAEKRAVLLVAHCLGGLICENALAVGSQHDERKKLVGCVKGVLLLGTPHFQPETLTAATTYFQLAQEAVPSDSDLKKKSKWVTSIPQKFAELRKAVPIDLECYYEGSNVKVGDSDVKIVDKSLAQCPEGSPAERLACNHERMSRFESEGDKDFAKILRVIKKWVAKIPPPEKEGTAVTLLRMAAQVATGATGEVESDLAQLWQAAVEDYEKTTKKSLRLEQFRSMDAIMNGTEGLSNKFKDFRDDKSKVAKVRTALKNNMWLIQKIVNAVQVVGGVASAFPPAMPASLIFTAFAQVTQSFADVSADYDKVMGFFEFTHRFFDRLSMIEDRMPKLPPFQRCVTRVFSSMLKICSVAQEYAKEKRFKKWLETLVNGSDGALSGANADMEQAVNELSQAVGLATLRTVEIMSDLLQSVDGNVEFLVSKSTIIEERTEVIQSNTSTIIKQNKDLESKQDEMAEMLKELSLNFNTGVDHFGSIQMGQDLAENFKTSLLKLDVVRLKLTRWGQSVGLANLDEEKSLQQAKLPPKDIPTVKKLLKRILNIFSNAERMSTEFQEDNEDDDSSLAVVDPAKALDKVSASLHQNMYDLAKKRQGNSELEPKGDLTMYEETAFERLIEDLNKLVDSLVELFPAIQEEQRKLAEEEVSEMKKIKEALPLLKEVAGQDKLLSEAVVKVIQSTSTYTNSVVFSGPNSGFQIGNNAGSVSGVRFG
ncbi:hypothetical protein OIDMADRAFT_57090 [Oidiodendron maius Zn]|uniref:DUF676 domain-containing protein n=1 Tax=Oidiodendron maius (strain Zn) TaxID=913774 RepID=A0A0C3GRR7_OIDMZ|nr:hypothetical protein OIDMADRAFT_57090 [Oidiodendron maius Zn]